jgi:very-short-patch-repair endonuclease
MQLDKATRHKLKLFKSAKKAQRKLLRGGHTKQQRDCFKATLANAYRVFPTAAEAKIAPQLAKLGFVRQLVECGYIADFANLEYKVMVEIDGKVHEHRKGYDANRDRVLRDNGWRIVRFTNARINSDMDGVIFEVKAALR